MKVSRRVLARHIAAELQNEENRSSVIDALAAYVVEYRLQSQLDLIVADISANLTELGHVHATVTTARPLTAELRDAISEYVKKIEKVAHITLGETVDTSVIGGIIVETASKRLDASVHTKLKRLRNA